jgi:hypothetical protein
MTSRKEEMDLVRKMVSYPQPLAPQSTEAEKNAEREYVLKP